MMPIKLLPLCTRWSGVSVCDGGPRGKRMAPGGQGGRGDGGGEEKGKLSATERETLRWVEGD